MSEDKMDVVIVGGGLAGLSAAYRLLEAGRQVISWNGAIRAGARTLQEAGFT